MTGRGFIPKWINSRRCGRRENPREARLQNPREDPAVDEDASTGPPLGCKSQRSHFQRGTTVRPEITRPQKQSRSDHHPANGTMQRERERAPIYVAYRFHQSLARGLVYEVQLQLGDVLSQYDVPRSDFLSWNVAKRSVLSAERAELLDQSLDHPNRFRITSGECGIQFKQILCIGFVLLTGACWMAFICLT